MNYNEKLSMQDGVEKANEETFRSMVGGLIYLTHSQPDLAHAVSVVSRFMQKPSKVHLGSAKRILKYVAGTIDYGIWYAKGKKIVLTGYSDSDWASNVDDQKILSAYVFSLCSGAVSWSSKKQPTVALSSTEVEYIIATGATSQAIWLRRILEDLGLEQEEPTMIYCDNKSSINLSKNPVHHSR
ncbi:putative RNA-directed DNA polymerase [Helianthus annuus]|nr:putative RNA-directed DNA polymerase [Helianthus annuus]